MMGFAMLAIGSELLKRAVGDGLDDEDDGEYIDDAFEIGVMSQVKLLSAMIPVLGPATMAGVNYANDIPWDDRVSASPAITAITTVVGTAVKAPGVYQDFMDGEDLKKKDVRDALTAMGLLIGVPVGAASKPINYLMDVESGEADPSGPIDFTRGLMTGRPGGQ
jgi:uncharacterized membrane protein YfcA